MDCRAEGASRTTDYTVAGFGCERAAIESDELSMHDVSAE